MDRDLDDHQRILPEPTVFVVSTSGDVVVYHPCRSCSQSCTDHASLELFHA